MFTWYQKPVINMNAVECSSYAGVCCLSGACCKDNGGGTSGH